MWNLLDDLRNWYLKMLNDGYDDTNALSYVNDKERIIIPFEYVAEIVNGVFGTQDILEDTRNELENTRIFNELLIEKMNALKMELEKDND